MSVSVYPLISVIVPVYNSEAYLDRCIQSITNQDYRCFELLLIDDGSTDKSPIICDRWQKKDWRIKTIHQENGGQSKARNTGLAYAQGDYIAFVDSDDYVTADYLSYLLSLFPQSDDCSVTACNHYIVRKGRSIPNTEEAKDRVFSAKEALESALFHECIDVSPWGKLYKKGVFYGTEILQM